MINYLGMDEQSAALRPEDLGHHGHESHFLRELVRASQVVLSAFAREVGMPGARLAVLRAVAVAEGEPLGTMEIARRLGVDSAAVTRQLQAMEADGLVRREPDGRDARRSGAVLTEAGREAFLAVHARAHEFEAKLADAVGAEAMAAAALVLGRVRGAVEATW